MSTSAADSLVEAHEYDGEELVRRATLERRNYERKSVAIRAKVTVDGNVRAAGAHRRYVARRREHHRALRIWRTASNASSIWNWKPAATSATFHIQAEVRYCVPMGDGRVPCRRAFRRDRRRDLRAHRGDLKNSRLSPGPAPRLASIPMRKCLQGVHVVVNDIGVRIFLPAARLLALRQDRAAGPARRCNTA